MRQVARCQRAEDPTDIVEDHGGGFHQGIDPGAQFADRAAFALERDALAQIAVARRAGDLLRLLDRFFQHPVGHDFGGDIGGDLDHFHHPAHLITDRRIDRLDPDFAPILAHPLEGIGLRLAGVQIGPELGVLRRGGVSRVDEHAVMLAGNLLALIAESLEENLVGTQDVTAEVELDIGIGLIDGIEDAAGVLPLDLGVGDVVAHAEVFHRLAVVAHDRRDHRIDIVGRAVLGAVLDDAAKDLATTDRRPELLEGLLGHVGRARGVVRLTDQFLLAVFRDLDELVVDAQDVTLLVGLRDDAGDIHDVGAHLQFALDIGQSRPEFSQRGFEFGALLCLFVQCLGGLLQFVARHQACDPGRVLGGHCVAPCFRLSAFEMGLTGGAV